MSNSTRLRTIVGTGATLLLAGAATLTGITVAAAQPSNQDQVYYKNCTEVRNAGKAPLYQGQPGYASHLDRDGDGIACETK
ncbi:excalibur calcium-binding domain-containing protein [Nocardia bovistercoris]|uniref:Excalibur calcium-binding domain-containing protein n=1 Tax=Nocardia bovistercoris TaxID=2785916 RepID=A0A931IE65_9NOCA|nr:excalibur calcium-binding domain-containing protein [Nocardia bovistercoris]MBH0778113.1 excalibur calcium-binding domain-containing protein [Nocardia bovistercoris]